MILIDLQKAFNTIRSWNLAPKIKAIRLSKEILQWQLTKQLFLVNISCGVPQGSILEPILLLIYLNDMPQEVRSTLLLYANDSSILYQHKEVDKTEKQLNEDFKNICDWFLNNQLSIHFGEDKTKLILFASIQRSRNVCQLNIRYNH